MRRFFSPSCFVFYWDGVTDVLYLRLCALCFGLDRMLRVIHMD